MRKRAYFIAIGKSCRVAPGNLLRPTRFGGTGSSCRPILTLIDAASTFKDTDFPRRAFGDRLTAAAVKTLMTAGHLSLGTAIRESEHASF